MIKILLADSSQIDRAIISFALSKHKQISIVGQTGAGEKVLEMAAQLKPSAVVISTNLKKTDLIFIIRHLIDRQPVPIILLNDEQINQDQDLPIKAMMAGATALVNKPAKDMLGDWIQPLINNIDSLTGLETPRKKSRPRISRTRQVLSKKPRPGKFKAVGIASSTGGPMALEHILKNLKPQFSASILIVQHITPGFSLELVNWYNKISPLEVRLAQKGDRLQPACVYLAPDNQHMEVTNHHITLHSKPQVCGFRPSGTVLLSSLAQNFPNQSLGIILTGMGKDGVEGMTQIKETGGYTIAQDKDSSVVFGMPARAIEAGAIDVVASLEEIPQMINQMVA